MPQLNHKCLLTFVMLALFACQKSKLDKQAFVAQIASREYVVTQIEIPDEGKKLIDTLKKAYNARKQLIVENENIFFRYDSTGKLTEKIICIDEPCQQLMTWRYEYQKEKVIVRQFRNEELQQIQELIPLKKQNISKVADSTYVFLTQQDFMLADTLIKSSYDYLLKDKETRLLLEQSYQYDSLGRVSQIVRIPDRDSTNCVKIVFFYDNHGRRIKSVHSRFMPIEGDINTYTDHYKVYRYDASNRLVEVRAFRPAKPKHQLVSITKYSYSK